MSKADQARDLAKSTDMSVAEIANYLGIHYSHAHQAIKSIQEDVQDFSQMQRVELKEKYPIDLLKKTVAQRDDSPYPHLKAFVRNWLISHIPFAHWQEAIKNVVISSLTFDKKEIQLTLHTQRIVKEKGDTRFETQFDVSIEEIFYVFAVAFACEVEVEEKSMDVVITIKLQDLYDSL